MTAPLRSLPDTPRPQRVPDPGDPPDLQWLSLTSLVIDPSYQRPTEERAARRLIARIAEGFRWDRFGALTVAPVDADAFDRFAVIDGQHRAAAARAAGIASVPCVVVGAKTAAAAAAWAGINRDRRNATSLQVFHAEIAAGDPEAMVLERIVTEAGLRLLRSPRPAKECRPGDVMCIGALKAARATAGDAGLSRALAILAAAGAAPVKALQVHALTLLIAAPEWREDLPTDATLARLLAEEWEAIEDAAALRRIDTDEPSGRCAAVEIWRAAQRAAP